MQRDHQTYEDLEVFKNISCYSLMEEPIKIKVDGGVFKNISCYSLIEKIC